MSASHSNYVNGKKELEETFAGKVFLTLVYIKIDAHNHLLLSEGVCSQLSILEYHMNIWPGCDLHSVVTNQN